MTRKSVKQRMNEFKNECLNSGKKFIANDGYAAYEIDQNKFNKIMADYSDIAELETCRSDRSLTLVYTRKSTGTIYFRVRFTDAKRGRPSKNQNTTETKKLWNGILEAAARAGK